MRIIHDMKNPLLGVKYRIEELGESSLENLNNIKELCDGIVEELNDAIDMTDQIRIGFKIKNDMKLEEDKTNLELVNFVNTIK